MILPYQFTNFMKCLLVKDFFILPPNLIFFVTSKCNLRCKHCFYGENLNKTRDLGLGQIENLCYELKGVYRISFGGGDPFLRNDLLEICKAFDKIACAKQLGIPTNATCPDTVREVCEDILSQCGFHHFHLNLSLDGLENEHDFIRHKGSFKQVIQTYNLLKSLKKRYKNFGMSVCTTIMEVNIDSLSNLTRYIYEEMEAIDQHILVLLRGTPVSGEIKLPETKKIRALFQEVLGLWRDKLGYRLWLVKRLMYDAQLRILEGQALRIICQAGRLSGVVYDNGDVCFCEFDKPIGNIKESSFVNIWNSELAKRQRKSIKENRCLCTHECFLDQSIIYDPFYILRNIRVS